MNHLLESLKEIMELAGNAVTDTGKLVNLAGSVKSLVKSSEKGADADLKLAVSELTEQVAHTKVTNSELRLQLLALQEALSQAQDFKSDIARYELWETPAGAIVYRLRKGAEEGQPMHYLCPTCIENSQKSILQGHEDWRKCTSCRAEYSFSKSSGIEVIYAQPQRDSGLW